MKISKQSLLTLNINSMDISISMKQLARINMGHSMMKIAPHLTFAEYEFLNSGATPQELNLITN